MERLWSKISPSVRIRTADSPFHKQLTHTHTHTHTCTNSYVACAHTCTHTCAHTHLADDVGDGVAGFDPAAGLGVDPQGHVHVRQALLVGVVLGVLGQRLDEHRE